MDREQDDVLQLVSVGLKQEWVDPGGEKWEKSSSRPENVEEDTRKKKKYCYKTIIYKVTSC